MTAPAAGIGARLRRSVPVYLWAVASTAWLIHSLIFAVRHGGILAEVPLDAAVGIVARTILDVFRPIVIGALVAAPFAAGGLVLGRMRQRA